MDVTWLDHGKPAERELAAVAAVTEAARQADTPARRPQPVSWHRTHLEHGFDGEAPLVGAARDGSRMLAYVRLSLPRRDNAHLAPFHIVVDPLLRRRGLGRELLGVVAERARAEGRRVLLANPWDDSPGPAFLAATGFEKAYEETLRVQHVLELDAERLAWHRAEAAPHAAGYETFSIEGALPDELLEAVAELSGAMNDAPTGTLDVEDEVYDAARLRDFDRIQELYGRRRHTVLARHTATGELAGVTVVAVEGDHPWQAWQFDTTVARAHRGHRLGLLLKLDMLRHLAGAEPQLRTIETWNASDNTHMVAINEQLGYRVAGHASEWQRPL